MHNSWRRLKVPSARAVFIAHRRQPVTCGRKRQCQGSRLLWPEREVPATPRSSVSGIPESCLALKTDFVNSSDGEVSTIQGGCFPERSRKPCRHFDAASLSLMRITPWNSVLLLSDTCAWLRAEHLFSTSWSGRVPCRLRVSPYPPPLDKLNIVNQSFSASLPGSTQPRRRGLFRIPCSLPSEEADSNDALGSGLLGGHCTGFLFLLAILGFHWENNSWFFQQGRQSPATG